MAPSSWSTLCVGDLVAEPPRNGYSPKEVAEYTGELMLGLGCLSTEGFRPAQLKNAPAGDPSLERARLTDGDILLSRSNTRNAVGFVGIYRDVGARCIYPDLMMRLRPLARVEPDFLVRQLQAARGRRQIEALASGTSGSMVKLNRDSVLRLRLDVPPLPEQRRIVKILDTIDEAIRKTEEILAKLKQVKQGLLHDLLTRGIDDNGELRDPDRHPQQFTDSPLGRIPKAWEVTTLDQLSEFVTSGSRGWAAYYADAGALFIRIGNLTREHINLRLSNLQHVRPPESSEGKRTALEPGDLLISITADLGIIGVVPDNLAEAYVNQHIALVRVDPSRANSRWVGHYMAAPTAQEQIRRLDDPGAKAGLNLPTVRALRCALPSGEEQSEIAARIDALDARVRREKRTRAKYDLIKQGVMEDLLTGRVRVTALLEQAAE